MLSDSHHFPSHLLQAESKDEAEKPSESAEKPTETEKEKNETTEKSEPQDDEESEGGESKTAGTDTGSHSGNECSWAFLKSDTRWSKSA